MWVPFGWIWISTSYLLYPLFFPCTQTTFKDSSWASQSVTVHLPSSYHCLHCFMNFTVLYYLHVVNCQTSCAHEAWTSLRSSWEFKLVKVHWPKDEHWKLMNAWCVAFALIQSSPHRRSWMPLWIMRLHGLISRNSPRMLSERRCGFW
jgi:hypothetical protein